MNGGQTALDRARTTIMEPSGLDDADLLAALSEIAIGTDLADLYLQRQQARSWRLENGIVKSGSFLVQQGVGARTSSAGDTAFAHSADMRPKTLMETACTVREMRRHGDEVRLSGGMMVRHPGPSHDIYPMTDAVGGTSPEAWIDLLKRVDAFAREKDSRVIEIDAQLQASHSVILVADVDRGLAADVRPLIRLSFTITTEQGGRRSKGDATVGGRFGLGGLTDDVIETAVLAAVRKAIVNLDARPAPVGRMSVVLAAGFPGVLFHEAVGHGLEADHHRKRLSVFTELMGRRIASPGVTIIDDGAMAGRLGSVGIDDEGSRGERTVLVENGVLVGLMQDRLNAGLMNARSTGNCRRQSYAHLPLPRMTNTFLAPGQDDPLDIVKSVTSGIYVTDIGGGKVDIVTGRFNFSTTEAWLIEDGRVTAPIDGATLIGVGHETLKNISMIGSDLAFDTGNATCSKQGQQLAVSVGQPTLRIDDMMVGGQAS